MKISLWELQEALRKSDKNKDFDPVLISSADFTNGAEFEIHQVNKRGACRITDTGTKKTSYAHNFANAWSNVRYQAGITWKNQRSS